MPGALLLLFVFLLPARGAALRGDDEWVFGFKGQLLLHHQSVISGIVSQMSFGVSHWRPQFLGDLASYLAIYGFDGHPSAYRIYLVLLTVIAAWLLARLVQRLGARPAVAALIVLVFAGAVQFRSYHDAMLGYYGATQQAFIFLLLSLLAFLRYLRGGMTRWAVVALVLFLCACGTQEFMYPLAASHLVLALTERRGWRAIRPSLPMMVAALLLLLIGFAGSSGAAQVVAGYGTSLNPHVVLASYVTQLFPPLPGAYRLFGNGPIAFYYAPANSPTPAELFAALWRGAAVFGGILAFVVWIRRRRQLSPQTASADASDGLAGRLVALGVPLWLAPPLLLAVSGKYQQELTAGKGYLEVLIQTAGVALIAVAALLCLLRIASRRGAVAVGLTAVCAAGLLGLGAGIDGFNNISVIASEQPVRHTRDLLETAAQRGAFDGIPQHSTLLFSAHDMAWPTGTWFYSAPVDNRPANTGEEVLMADSGRDYDVRFAADDPALEPLNCSATGSYPPPVCAPPEPSAAWVRVRATPAGGVVIISQIQRPTVRDLEQVTTTNLYVYTEQAGQTTPPVPAIAGTAHGRPWSGSGGAVTWSRVRSGDGWAIYQGAVLTGDAPIAYSLNDLQSHIDFLAPGTTDEDVRLFGASSLLP